MSLLFVVSKGINQYLIVQQKHLDEKELLAKKANEDLTNVEGEWKTKTDKLMKEIESLQV